MLWKHASSPSLRKFKVHYFLGCWWCTAYWLMPHKVTVMMLYYADLLHKLLVGMKENRQTKLTQVLFLLHISESAHRSHACFTCNLNLKQCVIHHILLIWYQVITICLKIQRNTSMKGYFWLPMSSNSDQRGAERTVRTFLFTSIENSEIGVNCALRKAVILLILLSLSY